MHSLDEQVAASAVASLRDAFKRAREDERADEDLTKQSNLKRRRTGLVSDGNTEDESYQAPATKCELQPAPFFYYKDYSRVEDDDPLTPLTPAGRVPNFPAKMHAILSRTDLADMVSWAPHGRAFRVLRPRQFEVHVIPKYFDHAKFSSFIRQANGWGFRRITQGPDRNCYFHEMFLRGMPHLCKKMQRLRSGGRATLNPDHEPDLDKISEMFPVNVVPRDESHAIRLPSTVSGGPKARMPVDMGLLPRRVLDAARLKPAYGVNDDCEVAAGPHIARFPLITPEPPCDGAVAMFSPSSQATIVSQQQRNGGEDSKLTAQSFPTQKSAETMNIPIAPKPPSAELIHSFPTPYAPSKYAPSPPQLHRAESVQSPTVPQSELRAAAMPQQPSAFPQQPHDPVGATQFAAGFAAATAMTQSAIQAMLQQAFTAALQQAVPAQSPHFQDPAVAAAPSMATAVTTEPLASGAHYPGHLQPKYLPK